MDNGMPIEPIKAAGDAQPSAPRRRGGDRAPDRRKKRPLSPGQLHLLRELMTEFSRNLTSFDIDPAGRSTWRLASKLPNLVEFIEHRVDSLRLQQESLETLYLGYDGR